MEIQAGHLDAVERWTLGLAALVSGVALVFAPRPMALGVSLGAALMVANSWALRRIGRRVVRTFARPGLAILLFNLKMLALCALVYVVMRYLPIDAIGFLVGVSVFPVAVVAAALSIGLRESTQDDSAGGTPAPAHNDNSSETE